jgi:hypothetical protein
LERIWEASKIPLFIQSPFYAIKYNRRIEYGSVYDELRNKIIYDDAVTAATQVATRPSRRLDSALSRILSAQCATMSREIWSRGLHYDIDRIDLRLAPTSKPNEGVDRL